MSKSFLVRIEGKEFLFSEEKFLKFCNNAKKHNWTFFFGEQDSNTPLRTSKSLSEEEFLNMFDLDKIQNLLKYRRAKFGTQWIVDMPFFSKEIYLKYGKEIGWKDEY